MFFFNCQRGSLHWYTKSCKFPLGFANLTLKLTLLLILQSWCCWSEGNSNVAGCSRFPRVLNCRMLICWMFFSGLQQKPYKTKHSQIWNGFSAVAQVLHSDYWGGNAGPLPPAHMLKICLKFTCVPFLSWFRQCSCLKIPLRICKWLHLKTLLMQGSSLTNDCACWNCRMFEVLNVNQDFNNV